MQRGMCVYLYTYICMLVGKQLDVMVNLVIRYRFVIALMIPEEAEHNMEQDGS